MLSCSHVCLYVFYFSTTQLWQAKVLLESLLSDGAKTKWVLFLWPDIESLLKETKQTITPILGKVSLAPSLHVLVFSMRIIH